MSVHELVHAMRQQQLVVVGDVILDEYLFGDATRMSREAPIPVLSLTERRCIAGGAANPAVNAAVLGAQVTLVSVVGTDAAAGMLRAALGERGLHSDELLASARGTPVKTRVMAQMGLRFPQQVARIDSLPTAALTADEQHALMERFTRALTPRSAALFSDYRGGVLTAEWVRAVRAQHPRHLFTADTQGNLTNYAGFNLVKCNAAELEQAVARPLESEEAYAGALAALAERLGLEAIVVTRGAEGASLFTAGGYQRIAAPRIRDVFDTVGAGDTFIAVATLARAAGAAWPLAVQIANAASGIVIQHVGNYAPSTEELLAAL